MMTWHLTARATSNIVFGHVLQHFSRQRGLRSAPGRLRGGSAFNLLGSGPTTTISDRKVLLAGPTAVFSTVTVVLPLSHDDKLRMHIIVGRVVTWEDLKRDF
jgi:hypothetical protein